MKKSLIVASWISVCLLTGSAEAADKASKAEAAGFGSGAVIGAAVGGPVGLIAGAAIGAAFGDKYRQTREDKQAIQALRAQTTDIDELNAALTRSLHEVESLSAENQQLVSKQNLITQLRMEVLFHTGEAEIDDLATQRLHDLATLVKTTPGVTVRLDGYADPRGDEDYNLKLSSDRADSVKEVLIQAGVSLERIEIYPQGEDSRVTDEADLDALALTRRVSVKLRGGAVESSVAQSF